MTIEWIRDHVVATLSTILRVEVSCIYPEARLREELGADSLDLVEMVIALEDELGIRISDGEARYIATVADVIIFIDKKLQEKATEPA